MVNVHEAKSTLSAPLARVELGEEIVIARNGRPVAKLIPVVTETVREPGSWRHYPGWADFTYDPALFAPVDDAALKAEGWL